MAMTSLLIILVAFFFLASPSHCLSHKQPSETLRDLVVGEKTRLGSTPPSCHNKCNQCHPCMAVQVPTLPSHNRVRPNSGQEKLLGYFESSPSSAGNRYSNYKPLGWKCRCGGHFFNP
ncbi:EPIDERMAL PATTERNING FACTOR-like protein [Perilla frutescens var. frutescens]|nr:EPIDERMAL PATTERNING FACTOR-like protein [Perilla frutescens var. frutescens]